MTLPPLPEPSALELVHEEDPFTVEWDVRPGFWARLLLRKRPGRARIVLQGDVLIWVPGDGRIPRVWRRDEVTRVRAGRRTLRIHPSEGAPEHVPGAFRPGDRTWLAELLEGWRSGA